MLLDDDGVAALWDVFDQTGIRPEWMAPVLYFESGFDPTRQNAAGAPYYGINQTDGVRLAELGTTVDAYRQLSQGAQIRLAVLHHFAAAVHSYGPIRSSTRAYQANFLPATLASRWGLGQILTVKPSAFYTSNAAALDPFHRGMITVADLAYRMAQASRAPEVRAAVARAYALRPSAAPAREAVYGDDFAGPLWMLAGVGALGAWATAR